MSETGRLEPFGTRVDYPAESSNPRRGNSRIRSTPPDSPQTCSAVPPVAASRDHTYVIPEQYVDGAQDEASQLMLRHRRRALNQGTKCRRAGHERVDRERCSRSNRTAGVTQRPGGPNIAGIEGMITFS